MSQENVEVVAGAYEALRRSGVDAFSEYWTDDIEWQTMRSRWFGPNAGRAGLLLDENVEWDYVGAFPKVLG